MTDAPAAGPSAAICARLRGEALPLSAAMVETARTHRVHLLLADSLLPGEEDLGLTGDLRSQAIIDAAREPELRRLIDVLATAGIETLLLKGAGLAYTVYRAPHLRPRVDLDVLIRPERLAAADQLLISRGWIRATEPDALLASGQRHYYRRRPNGLTEALDLHWRIANPRLFGDAIGFDALWATAVPVPALGHGARTLAPAEALFIACLHRVAHHNDAIDLLWLWDIHLLATALAANEATRLVNLAGRSRMRGVCVRGLSLAADHFHTAGAAALIAALDPPTGDAEPSARFVGGGLSSLDLLYEDLAATSAWRARVRLVREHLFPPRSYIDSVYARWPAALRPLAYAYRIGRGAPAWLRRPRAGS